MNHRVGVVLVGLGLLAATVGSTAARPGTQQEVTPPPANAGVSGQLLALTEPSNAEGLELAIRQTTIEPGGGLAPHQHPGDQLISLQSGTLTLVVVSGEVPITRVESAATPGPTEVLTDGESTDLNPGDSWVEAEGVVHYAVNNGSEPVVLRAATLYTAGAPAVEPVDIAATPIA